MSLRFYDDLVSAKRKELVSSRPLFRKVLVQMKLNKVMKVLSAINKMAEKSLSVLMALKLLSNGHPYMHGKPLTYL